MNNIQDTYTYIITSKVSVTSFLFQVVNYFNFQFARYLMQFCTFVYTEATPEMWRKSSRSLFALPLSRYRYSFRELHICMHYIFLFIFSSLVRARARGRERKRERGGHDRAHTPSLSIAEALSAVIGP